MDVSQRDKTLDHSQRETAANNKFNTKSIYSPLSSPVLPYLATVSAFRFMSDFDQSMVIGRRSRIVIWAWKLL